MAPETKKKDENYEVVLIKPERPDDKRMNEEIRSEVTKLLEPKRRTLQVRGIKLRRNNYGSKRTKRR